MFAYLHDHPCFAPPFLVYTHAYAYGQMVNAANQEPTYDFIAVGVEDYGGSLFVLNIRF